MTTARAYIASPDSSPAFWQIGNLWRVMATGVQTGNSFCLLDQLVTDEGGGPCTHTHTQDEGLYVVSGRCTFHAGGHTLAAGPGAFVAVPRRTEHAFTVDAPGTQLLNFYLPAGFEVLLMGVAHPAEHNALPPSGVPLPPRSLVEQLARDYGQTAVLGMPFADPPGAGDTLVTKPTPGAVALPFRTDAATAPAYWQAGGLWSLLVDGAATDGSYSLLEQLMPPGPQASPHLHEGMDEVFYLLEGEVEFLLEDRLAVARKGDLIFIPRGTVHGFRVLGGAPARALNLYTPAGFERTVAALAPRAQTRTLPPAGWTPPEVPEARRTALFAEVGMRRVILPALWPDTLQAPSQ